MIGRIGKAMLHKLIKGIAIFVLTLPINTPAHTQWFSPSAGSDRITTLRFDLIDDTRDECWTNSADVEAIAMGKLHEQSYVLDAEGADYIFQLQVTAFRQVNATFCIGTITIRLFQEVTFDGLEGRFVLIESVRLFNTRPDGNANDSAMDAAGRVLEDLAAL